jgi:hypothetical protein
VVVASESSAGGLKNALPTVAGWLQSEVAARRVLAAAWLETGAAIDPHHGYPPWHHHWLSHEEGFVFIVGIDPHKGSHTAAVLDHWETVIGELRVTADRRQRDRLLEFAASFAPRTWAIESASGLGGLLAQQLVAVGESVLDVPPTLSAGAVHRPIRVRRCREAVLRDRSSRRPGARSHLSARVRRNAVRPRRRRRISQNSSRMPTASRCVPRPLVTRACNGAVPYQRSASAMVPRHHPDATDPERSGPGQAPPPSCSARHDHAGMR